MPDERNNDIISEQVFSKEQTKSKMLDEMGALASPAADSPGDSEEDATAEFMLGLNFRPESEDPFEESEEEEFEDFEKSDHTVYAEQKSGSAGETPSLELEQAESKININNSARVVSSGRPSPRSDATSSTSTN